VMENQSSISEFFLQGISKLPEQKQFLFGIFLCMYLVTLTGNMLIFLAIRSDPHPHTSTYFFLTNLSFVDIGLTSSTVTKMLVNVQTQHHTISYAGSPKSVPCCLHSWLSFSVAGEIAHFFCDITLILKLSCSDTHISMLMVFAIGGTVLIVPFICIVISYIHFILAFLRVQTPGVEGKAFSTCSSHLCVVCVFYGMLFSAYLWSASVQLQVYTVVTPMLNPFIYRLRNKDMKGALKRLLSHRRILSS
uniref:Olfactory receptor family 1 subfamily N member 1 n=1 Tax=Panthera tigris altaica TaxID=74533 RepID=A0A8C9K845_PANTA